MGGNNSKTKSAYMQSKTLAGAASSSNNSSPRFTPRPSPDLNDGRAVVRINSDKRYSVPVITTTPPSSRGSSARSSLVPPIAPEPLSPRNSFRHSETPKSIAEAAVAEIQMRKSEHAKPIPPKVRPKTTVSYNQNQRHSIAAVGSLSSVDDQSARLADIQLVLHQLCEKKPKYNLLKQMDFESLDEKAQFIVFEAACEILDQSSTIDRLQSEKRLFQTNMNVLKRVKSFDNIDNPKARRTASREMATVIKDEIQFNPPKLSKPKIDAAVAELVQVYKSLEKKFVEILLPDLQKNSKMNSTQDICKAVQKCLKEMLATSSCMKDSRVKEILDLAVGPKGTPDSQSNLVRIKLQLNNQEARHAVDSLLFNLSALSRVSWQTFVKKQDYAFISKSSQAEHFFSDCATWTWRVACAGLGDIFLSADSKVYNSDLHNVMVSDKEETGKANLRTIKYFLWPILYRNKTAISKGLVQL